MDSTYKLCNKVETLTGFSYLGCKLNAIGGCGILLKREISRTNPNLLQSILTLKALRCWEFLFY